MRNSTKDFWTSTPLFCNPSGKIPFRVTLDSNSHEYHATLVCQIELIGPIRQENLESHCARHLEVSSHVRSWKMCRNTSLWNSNSKQYLPEILKRIEQARATRIPIFLQSILIYIYGWKKINFKFKWPSSAIPSVTKLWCSQMAASEIVLQASYENSYVPNYSGL